MDEDDYYYGFIDDPAAIDAELDRLLDLDSPSYQPHKSIKLNAKKRNEKRLMDELHEALDNGDKEKRKKILKELHNLHNK